MKARARIFGAIVVLQALTIVGWAGYHEVLRQVAPVILLQGAPADPQDLLRGDYLALRYDIGVVPPSGSERFVAAGEDVWVLLAPRGRYYGIAATSRTQPVTPPGQVLVRGTVAAPRWSQERIQYGIENYFVPEGKGRPSFRQAEVEVSVSPGHRLYLRRLFLDGKPYP